VGFLNLIRKISPRSCNPLYLAGGINYIIIRVLIISKEKECDL
jgi:hypothetical protein